MSSPPAPAPGAYSVYAKLVLVQVFWAGTFVASEIALHGQPPGLTALVRFVLTTLCYLALLGMLRDPAAPPLAVRLRAVGGKGLLVLAGMGLFGIALYTLFLNFGLGQTSAAYAALLIPTTQPLFTAFLSRLATREAIPPTLPVGLLLGVAGATLVIAEGVESWTLLAGTGLILLSALSFSFYAVCAKFAPQSLSSLENTAVSVALGTLFLVPVPYVLGEPIDLANASAGFWFCIAYLVVFATTLPYLWWNDAVKAIGSSRTGIFTFLMPPLAVLLAALVLGHAVTPQQIAGGALALAGVAVSTFGLPNWLWRREARS